MLLPLLHEDVLSFLLFLLLYVLYASLSSSLVGKTPALFIRRRRTREVWRQSSSRCAVRTPEPPVTRALSLLSSWLAEHTPFIFLLHILVLLHPLLFSSAFFVPSLVVLGLASLLSRGMSVHPFSLAFLSHRSMPCKRKIPSLLSFFVSFFFIFSFCL